MKPLKRILVPVDFSPCSDAALELAADLAEQYGAEVDILHVWQPPQELGAFVGLSSVPIEGGRHLSLTQFIMAEAQDDLDGLVEQLDDRQLAAVRAHLEEGSPRRVILDFAEQGTFDLLVMGTNGRTGLAHLFMGSVTEWVVRHAQIPVLTVRAPASAASRHRGTAPRRAPADR